jgi:3-hydroxyacyl-[acyl-carrier-protein] dehydratase
VSDAASPDGAVTLVAASDTLAGAAVGAADIAAVMSLLPHRFPMLLVDRVEDIVLGQSARGIKAVSINEPFFAGHFPGRPIMPGVLIIEALAQTAGVLALKTLGEAGKGKLVYFMAIDGAKFRIPVEPGCLLDLKVEFTQNRGRISKFNGRAEINGKLAAECSFTAMIADPPAAG